MKSPIPRNEEDRLRVLRLYHFLDVAAQKTMHNFTQLAAAICETPISLITIVDRDDGRITSSVGTEPSITPRELSFCAHALTDSEELLVIEDATQDERFSGDPAVTGEPSIRFYAGAPLTVDGDLALGTLCVIAREPHTLSDFQKEVLKLLSTAIVNQLELRRVQEEIRAIKQLLPMCAWCRNIRDADGQWQSLHEYILESVPVTHGICPDCTKTLSNERHSSRNS